MTVNIPFSTLQEGMCEFGGVFCFYFFEAIEIELSDEALIFLVSKVEWDNFFFHF